MGAAVFVELNKPSDASDIIETKSLDFAKLEIIRLRQNLGHLADQYGMTVVSLDASDLIHGVNDTEDFNRCVNEIKHIRSCLRLNTRSSSKRPKRQIPVIEFDPRKVYHPAFIAANYPEDGDNAIDSGSDSTDSNSEIDADNVNEAKYGRK